jgi:serine/threonine-protein kinase
MPDNARVRQLLEQMLDSNCTPEELCGGDPELLREVRLGWERLRRIEGEVEALFPTSVGAGNQRDATPLPSDRLPQVPGYHVEGLLGYGGMGIVYLARHLKLNRPVALKMLRAGAYAGQQDLARFIREAEAVAALRHPNIVQVYEVGDLDGLPFYTMEFVEGGSLARELAGVPQSPHRAATVVATLAGAVQFAHTAGIIHRDLKPANILLTLDGTPKITDFGLARRVESGPEFTHTGVRLGTPSYMAPEQALGQRNGIGPAVDVYALGAILYEMLTGRPPFRAETAAETERQVITDEPVRPSRLNPKIPRDLETICLKCLRKEPAKRYSSAQELADDLGRFLDGRPTLARPTSALERAVKWARRRPAVALLAGALLLLCGAALATGFWLRHREADRQMAQEQRAGQARTDIRTALTRATDLGREERWREALLIVTEAMTQLPEAASPQLADGLTQAQEDIRIALALEGARESCPLQRSGSIDYAQRAIEYEAAFERARLRIDDDPEVVARSIRDSAIRDSLLAAVDDRAFVAFMVNDRPLVERLLRIARLADPEPHWRDRFRAADAWKNPQQLDQLANEVFQTSPAPPGHQIVLLGLLMREAKSWRESTRLLGEACRRQSGNFWLNREMGAGLFMEARCLEAAAYYRAALALRPDNVGVLEGLGTALFHAGRIEDGLATYRRAVDVSSASHSTRVRLVCALAEAGYWKDARAECERAVRLDPSDHLSPHRLGILLGQHNRRPEAIRFLQQATKIAPTEAQPHTFLGGALLKVQRYDEAIVAFRTVTKLVPKDAAARYTLARALVDAGRPAEAIPELQMAVDLVPGEIWYSLELGAVLRSQGRSEEAVTAFRKSVGVEPRSRQAWRGVAAALLDQGNFGEARVATQRLLDLPATDDVLGAERRQLELCETLLGIEADLPAILAAKKRLTEVVPQRALAEWCFKHRRLPATAAGLYSDAFAAQPSLLDDREAGYRFNAACAAVLAGCGVGEDASKLDGQRRAALRQQALDWMSAEYRVRAEQLRSDPRQRRVVLTDLRSWLANKDLAEVRDEAALARLSTEERRAWQTFWSQVETLVARDPVALVKQARDHLALQEWQKAVERYAEAFELEPSNDSHLWFEYAAAQLLAGNREGYRRTCAEMIVRCQSPSPLRPYLVARAGTLAADSTEDWAALELLAMGELHEKRSEFWSLTEQGALYYRAGRFQEVTTLLERSLAVEGHPGRAILNWLWLALTCQKLGKVDEARRWLAKAADWLDQQEGRMPPETSRMGMDLHNWLEAHVLRQEAEALLR